MAFTIYDVISFCDEGSRLMPSLFFSSNSVRFDGRKISGMWRQEGDPVKGAQIFSNNVYKKGKVFWI